MGPHTGMQRRLGECRGGRAATSFGGLVAMVWAPVPAEHDWPLSTQLQSGKACQAANSLPLACASQRKVLPCLCVCEEGRTILLQATAGFCSPCSHLCMSAAAWWGFSRGRGLCRVGGRRVAHLLAPRCCWGCVCPVLQAPVVWHGGPTLRPPRDEGSGGLRAPAAEWTLCCPLLHAMAGFQEGQAGQGHSLTDPRGVNSSQGFASKLAGMRYC